MPKATRWIVLLTLLASFYTIGNIPRHHTLELFSLFVFVFVTYAVILKFDRENVHFWVLGSFGCRMLLFFHLPNLSDDFYRFIWDGRLWLNGMHPFTKLPSEFLSMNLTGIDQSLFDKLNSKNYFTIYPPVAQGIFMLSAKFSNSMEGSVLAMRVLILLAEAGSIYLLFKIIAVHKLPKENVLLYALNPLVIVELTGNLHFEAFMIFFLLLSFFWFTDDKLVLASVAFALAIGVKLVPIIFLPIFIFIMPWRKSITFYFSIVMICVLLFIPMYNQQVIDGFSQSLNLYFQKFEFNASLYYLVREYGFWKYGYNTIQTTGLKMAVWCSVVIMIFILFQNFALLKKIKGQWSIVNTPLTIDYRLLTTYLFILTIYFTFATTVHPWYITTLVALSTLSNYRYAVLWSGLILMTYSGYSVSNYSENLWLAIVEYLLVFAYLSYEIAWKRNTSFYSL
jgi:hypothetical protein